MFKVLCGNQTSAVFLLVATEKLLKTPIVGTKWKSLNFNTKHISV
jgi:hypothetical protein